MDYPVGPTAVMPVAAAQPTWCRDRGRLNPFSGAGAGTGGLESVPIGYSVGEMLRQRCRPHEEKPWADIRENQLSHLVWKLLELPGAGGRGGWYCR